MYYEEKWIDGKLYWRGTPAAEWTEMTMEQYRDKLLETVRNREAKIEKPDQWISVEDRLPEENIDVLVANEKGVYTCAAHIFDGNWHDILSGRVNHSFITHWMPLPQSPNHKTES